MNSVDSHLAYERHALFMAEQGLYPENAPKHRQRIAELEREREQQHKDYCRTFEMIEAMQPKATPLPRWLRPMSPDNWIDRRRIMRTQRYEHGHH